MRPTRKADLPFYYDPKVGWVMCVPRYPVPAAEANLKRYVSEPFIVNHMTRLIAKTDMLPAKQLQVIADLVAGKIQFNVLGDSMDGKGDIRAFEAPMERQREYSYQGVK